VTVACRTYVIPKATPWADPDETEVTGRTGGHQSAGQPDPGRPNQMTGHRTAGHRTAGQPEPDIGTEWVDTQWWTPTGDGHHGRPWPSRPRQGRPTAGTPSASSAVQMSPGRSATGQLNSKDTAKAGLATAATRQRQGDTPPSKARLGALLSSDDYGSRVERLGACHPLGRWLEAGW
jgi:hypothetical protein